MSQSNLNQLLDYYHEHPDNVCVHVKDEKSTGIITITFAGENTRKQLLRLLQLGLNTWDMCPKEFRNMDDIIRHGSPLEKL